MDTSPPNGPLTPRGIPPQDISTIELQLDRFYRARDGMHTWAMLATECVDFVEGRQITEMDRREMMDEGRPVISLNKIAPLVRLVKGYFRQNRIQTHVKPGNDGIGSQAVADALNLLMKQIDESCGSTWQDADTFYSGIMAGRGFWDTRLDFENNIFGDILERATDPFATYIDPEATSYEPKYWGFVQQGTWMSLTDIEQVFGKAARELINDGGGAFSAFPVRLDSNVSGNETDITPLRSFALSEEESRSLDQMGAGAVQGYNLWDHLNKERKLIRVVECQHRVWTRGPFVLDMKTGEKRPIPLHWTRERIAALEEFVRVRSLPLSMGEGTYKRIRWTVSAADKLLYDNFSLYRDFTVTPYFPYFRRGVTRGMVEDLLDPQREINKRRSNMLHILTTMAHSGWMFEEGAITPEMEETLEVEGGRPGLMLKYMKGFERPERIMPGIPSRGHELAGVEAEEDLKQIAGINDSALGEIDKVQSGRAVQARQKQAVVGMEEYFENFDRSMELKGRVRMNIIQDYYTEPRIVRVRGDDGKDEITMINAMGVAGEIVNNVGVGSYMTAVDKQPLSATFKDAQFAEAMEMRQQGIPVPDDIIVDLSSVPGKEIIKQRITQVLAAQGVAGAGGAQVPAPAPGGGGQVPSSAAPQRPALPKPGSEQRENQQAQK